MLTKLLVPVIVASLLSPELAIDQRQICAEKRGDPRREAPLRTTKSG